MVWKNSTEHDALPGYQDAVMQAGRDVDGVEPSILLGNGFSIALAPECFSYRFLAQDVDLEPEVHGLFAQLGTSDFEGVIRILHNCAKVCHEIGHGAAADAVMNLVPRVQSDLVKAIARHHPARSSKIDDAKKAACVRFIGPYRLVFSTNYDLLLYWSLMSDDAEHSRRFDGFSRTDKSQPLRFSASNPITTYYLHGALHLSEGPEGIEKLAWRRTGTAILDEVNHILASGRLPLVVAEGNERDKRARIGGNDYLRTCMNALIANTAPLVTYGMAFGEQDQHLADAIAWSKTPTVYVGVYSPTDFPVCMRAMTKAQDLRKQRIADRQNDTELEIRYYDSSGISPWEL